MTKQRLNALFATVALVLSACDESQNTYVPPPPPEVTVATPALEEVTDYLEYTGNLTGIESVEIRARVSGFLDQVHYRPGDRVAAGDLLFTIDPRPFKAEVNSAEAKLDAVRADLELKTSLEERAKYVAERGAGSEVDYLVRKAERQVAEASIEVTEASLEQVRLELSYTDVRSPIPGRVNRNFVDQGALVGHDDATLLTTVVNDSEVYAYFSLSEADLLDILRRYGQPKESVPEQDRAVVYLALADETGYPHQGYFDSAESEINPDTGTLVVRARFPNPDNLLVPGAFVRLRIPLATREAVVLPEVAVLQDQAGDFVLIVDDANKVERRPVVLGKPADGRVPVEQGLDGTERVVVNGLLRARPGAEVNPVEATAEATPAADSPKR